LNQLSQILKVDVHVYQPPERIEKLEEMKEGVKSLKEPVTKVEEVEEVYINKPIPIIRWDR